MGDYNRWQQEADFTADILHMAATRVIAVNIGPRNLKVDLNLRDLRRLFPGKTGPESIKAPKTVQPRDSRRNLYLRCRATLAVADAAGCPAFAYPRQDLELYAPGNYPL